MKMLLYLMIVLNVAHAAEFELGEIPKWQEQLLKKINFDANVRTAKQLLDKNVEVAGDAVFIVFTAETKENLEQRLLSVDVEVSFADARVRRFEGISFCLLEKGVECDVRKVSGLTVFDMPEDETKKEDRSAPPKVIRVKILAAFFK